MTDPHAVRTERLPRVGRPRLPRPRTLRLPVVAAPRVLVDAVADDLHGAAVMAAGPRWLPPRARRRPARTAQQARVDFLLDRWAEGMPRERLEQFLVAQVWPKLPEGVRVQPTTQRATLRSWLAHLGAELTPVLAPLRPALAVAAPMLAADCPPPTPCDERDRCAFHQQALWAWWDVLHPVSDDVLTGVPQRARAAMTGER